MSSPSFLSTAPDHLSRHHQNLCSPWFFGYTFVCYSVLLLYSPFHSHRLPLEYPLAPRGFIHSVYITVPSLQCTIFSDFGNKTRIFHLPLYFCSGDFISACKLRTLFHVIHLHSVICPSLSLSLTNLLFHTVSLIYYGKILFCLMYL